jgi:hypothetical protein
MNFLLLGIDSLIAGAAICLMVDAKARLPLAALFGIADGVGFLIGAGLGWHLTEAVTGAVGAGVFVVLGLYLLVVAAGTGKVAATWPLWVLPFALTLDNLAFGLGDHSTSSQLQQAGEQALSSALLALVGLLVAVVLPRVLPVLEQRVVATRFAGAATVLAAGGLVLLG